MTSPPCAFCEARFPCEECNRYFRIGHVSYTTSRTPQTEIPYVNENDVLRVVEYLWRAKIANVINYFVKTVTRTKKQVTCVIRDLLRTCCLAQVIRYYKYFMNLGLLKIRGTLISPHYTYLIAYACNSSLRSAKMWKTAETACGAARGSSRSGTTRSGSY